MSLCNLDIEHLHCWIHKQHTMEILIFVDVRSLCRWQFTGDDVGQSSKYQMYVSEGSRKDHIQTLSRYQISVIPIVDCSIHLRTMYHMLDLNTIIYSSGAMSHVGQPDHIAKRTEVRVKLTNPVESFLISSERLRTLQIIFDVHNRIDLLVWGK